MLLNKIELIGCRMSRLTCATCNRQNSESKSGDILRMAISGDGMQEWYGWLRKHVQVAGKASLC
jgi:hypothetical protein